jgi:hypothetical protein
MLPSVRDLALFLAPLVVTAIGMVLVSAGLGDRILPKGVLEIGERSGLGIAVGLAICGQAGFLLAAGGRLRAPVILVLALVGAAGSVSWLHASVTTTRKKGVWSLLALLGASTLFFVACYPPLAFDELVYHLPIAESLARHGALTFQPELRVPAFPLLGEAIQAELRIFGGDAATHFASWCALIATATLLYAWAAARGGSFAGAVAAALWLGGPQVLYLAGTGYLELLLALWIGAALYAVERLGESPRGWWIAGLLAGSAAACKYLGLFFVGWVGLEVWLTASGRRARALGIYAAGVALAAGPTYLYLVLTTGNPLFPFAGAMFGFSPWSPQPAIARPAFADLAAWLTLPWDVVFRRQIVGELPPFQPLLLLAAPLVLSAAWRDGRARLTLLLAAFYSLLLPIHSRYLILVLPPLIVVAAREAARLAAPVATPRRWLAGAALVVLLMPGAGWLAFHLHRMGPLPIDDPGRDRFWSARLPLWPAVRFVNRTAGPGEAVYLLHGENMHALAKPRLLGDYTGELPFSRVEQLARNPGALRVCLRTAGADYLVLRADRGVETQSGLWQESFDRIYEDPAAEVFRVRDTVTAERR